MFPTIYFLHTPATDIADASEVKLLLHGDGTDGSTTIVDSSIYNRTANRFGDTHIDTAQSKFGGASIYFDGSGDYIQYGPSTDFDLTENANWTVECWARWNVVQYRDHIFQFGISANDRFLVFINVTPGVNKLILGKIVTNASDEFVSTSFQIVANTWYHIAAMRKAGLIYFFVDGNLIGTMSTAGMFSGSTELTLGYQPYTPNFTEDYFNGWIDDFRYIVGAAVYPVGGFTPPTAPHPNP